MRLPLAICVVSLVFACGSPAPQPAPFVAPLPAPVVVAPPSPAPDAAVAPPHPVAAIDGGAASAADGGPAIDPAVAADTVTAASRQAGPIATSGTLDTARIVRANHERMERDRAAPVHVLDIADPLEAGRALCDAVVPRRPPETPVLVKPNLAGFQGRSAQVRTPTSTRRTGTEFLRGVLRCLHTRGHRHITVADGLGSSDEDLQRWYRRIGMFELAQAENVTLAPFGTPAPGQEPLAAPFAAAHFLENDLLVPRALASVIGGAGLYISVPKMKMHRFAVMTLSIKNAMGAVLLSDGNPPHRQKWRMHAELGAWMRDFDGPTHRDDRDAYVRAIERFAERIVDVLEVELPDAVLIDGIPPVAGDGFDLDEPLVSQHVAIGGTNPILADAVALEWMGYLDNAALEREIRHRTSPVVEEAALRFYGTTEVLRAIPIEGDMSFRTHPRIAHFRGMPGFNIGR